LKAAIAVPKALREYDWRQWLRLRPLLHVVKTARYRKIDRRFLRQPAKDGDVQDYPCRRPLAASAPVLTT